MDILNSNNKLKKHLIHKKYKLLVEVTFKDGEFVISQKLNSFFGQIGVFEGGDKLIKFVELYFKSVHLDYLDNDDSLTESSEEPVTNKSNVFFLPVIIYFYFADKKCDFFINSVFTKKYYIDKKNISLLFDFLKYKQWCYFFSFKKFYFEKLTEYIHLLYSFKNNFKISKNFYNLLNLKSIDFLLDDDKTYAIEEEIIYLKKNKKKRILFFKKILSKSKNNLVYISKKINWFSLKFVLNLIIHKHLFLNFFYKHTRFFVDISNFLSQIYSMKNRFFYKFRRYKRFKKEVYRNYFGKKISYFKIYRYDDKSKKNAKKK